MIKRLILIKFFFVLCNYILHHALTNIHFSKIMCTILNPGNNVDFYLNNDDEYLSLESSLPERMKYGHGDEA